MSEILIEETKVQINGWGPEVSPLMLVSDYPGPDEIKFGKALVGSHGNTIGDFLRLSGYSLNGCYKTNFIKYPMNGYGSKNRKKAQGILDYVKSQGNWTEILKQEIKDIQPNVILAFGELALRALTVEKNINNFRGSILPISKEISDRNIRVIPTFHPRDIVLNPLSSVYLKTDYDKALKYLNDTSEYKEPGNLWICKTTDALIEYWKRAKHGPFLVFDIETWYNFVTCISFCTDGNESVSVSLLDKDTSIMEKVCLWKQVNEILRSPIPKVNQNIGYDETILRMKYGVEVRNIIGDTMLMAHTLYCELPKGLNFLTSLYTDIPYYKDEGREYNPKIHDFSRMLYYNAKDSLATHKVWTAQLKDCEELGLTNFYNEKVMPLYFHYQKINRRGITVDTLVKYDLIDKYTNLLTESQKKIDDLYGQNLNINSPKQVAEFVYDFLKCPLHTHTNNSGELIPSTGEEVIQEIYLNEITDETRRDILQEILFCRKLDKVIEFLNTPYHYDGKFRSSYNLAGTENGRTSGSASIGWFFKLSGKAIKVGRLGASLQTIPKHGFIHKNQRYGNDIRNIFVPSSGKIFFDADGSNAEGHIVAVLCEDWEMLEYMKAGGDIHKLTASWIYNQPVETIVKPSDERDIGKMARHAGNLGQSPSGLSIQINKPISFTRTVMERFHKNAPKVQEVFHYEITNRIKGYRANRFLMSPHGRRRDFFGRVDDHMLKEAFSFIPQSTCSDHYKFASLKISNQTEHFGAEQLFEAHDGLMWEIPYSRLNEFAQIVKTEMTQPINFKDCTLSRDYNLTIPVELGYSDTNWKEMKDFQI